VIVDEYEIAGGGIIAEAIEDKFSAIRDNVIVRNYKWEKSIIAPEQRAEKYNQKPTLILITGPQNAGKKEVAKALESKLFSDGKIVYFLGIGNVKYEIDADIAKNNQNREEHLRRLADVAHIMLDAGTILIVTARKLKQVDLEIIKTVINPDKIITVWTGVEISTDIIFDLKVPSKIDVEESLSILKNSLYKSDVMWLDAIKRLQDGYGTAPSIKELKSIRVLYDTERNMKPLDYFHGQ